MPSFSSLFLGPLMQYSSTRSFALGDKTSLDFKGVTLGGLARDGGLYLPDVFPKLSKETISSFKGMPYDQVAFQVMKPFIGGAIDDVRLKALLADVYGNVFSQREGKGDPAPLVEISPNLHILELFHGPTLAFKDFALQFLGKVFQHFMQDKSTPLTILGATSGDTGSAAIEATKGLDNVRIIMLHPLGKVSDVQRKQMTSVKAPNVTNIAIKGSFDDCQSLVKACFNDLAFRDAVNLTAVNSINWARILAQVVYYFTSAAKLGAPDMPVSFSVPTGNFGDIFAGFIAKQMGLPIKRLIIASNQNNILTRTWETGRYERGSVHATLSPSMDIQISSNFERLLFNLAQVDGGGDGNLINRQMVSFENEGGFDLSPGQWAGLKKHFDAVHITDDETQEIIGRYKEDFGYLPDPHTAVGLGAAEAYGDDETPFISLATAHPAKFGDAVLAASGITPGLPPHLAGLMDRQEHFESLAADVDKLKAFIKS